MYIRVLIGLYLISSWIDKAPATALRSLLSNPNVFRGFPEERQKNGDYNPRTLHRFSIPESGFPDLEFKGDRQETLLDSPTPESGKDNIPNDGLYLEKNNPYKYALETSQKIMSPRERHLDDGKSNSWNKDDFRISWWKNYLVRLPNVNEKGYYFPNDRNISYIKPSLRKKSNSSQHLKELTIDNGGNDNIHQEDDHIKGQRLITKNHVGDLLQNFENNFTNPVTEIPNLIINKNNVNSMEIKSEPLRLNSPNQIFESRDTVKFPEKAIITRVYNMIKSVNNLHRLGSDPKENVQLSDEEILPEAQRRFAGNSFEDTFEEPSTTSKDTNWNFENVQFTTISLGSLMLFLILVVMVLALRVHCRNAEKTSQEWIRHPVVQPSTATSDGIQPNFQHILHPGHLSTEPIRIKAKGLLERRGSNTSLTIDLCPGSEGADVVFSPSRECTPENFLMTAGSRMSRRQLRLCLRDTRDLHAEFWQIPTNHPDKCGVPGAAAKNRYRTVLPNEETRVVLHKAPPDSPETPASQYINANYIRGYDGEERAYVATQGPLAHTVEDLWLLVLQERSPAVVMITRLKEKGRVKCEPYIPSYAASYGSVNVTVKQVIQKNGYTVRQIYLKHGDEVHTTLHFWFTSWPDHKAPSSARHLLAMASEVETARKDCRGPVIVHCSAGIGRTGCFIAVSIGRSQLLEEDCVDILSIVCQMRLDRGGMVQTAEQYEFIHRALALYEASLPSTASAE